MQMKKRNLSAKPNLVAKSRVTLVPKPRTIRTRLSAAKFESQIMKKKFEELKERGVLKQELDYLIKLNLTAVRLSTEADALMKRKKPNSVEVQARAAKAWELFYQELSRYR
jgi:hypothetical protein